MTDLPIKRSVPKGLVVSCQAPVDSPLHGRSDVMAAMALAAVAGGAVGIRANGPDDIAAIRAVVDVPIIGLYKRRVGGVNWITTSYQDAEVLVAAGADVIAVDATIRPRPFAEQPHAIIDAVRSRLRCPVMADIDDLDAARQAFDHGADVVGTTLAGYTPTSRHTAGPDLELLAAVVSGVGCPVVAEGRFSSPQHVSAAMGLGAHAVVIGTAITDPFSLTASFAASVPPS